MKERPILFSAPMVRALLAGTKTQTRRIAKPVRGYEHNNICRPDMAADRGAVWWHGESERVGCMQACPYGVPGDRLWVRESWRPRIAHSHGFEACDCEDVLVRYAADNSDAETYFIGERIPTEWCIPKTASRGNVPGIHMPRWASRITLEVTGVRVERLHSITDEDARAEGVEPYTPPHGHIPPEQRVPGPGFDRARLGDQPHRLPFADLWCKINGDESWDANPWVWVVSFKRIEVRK